jgi:diacylglycerol kinase (ATP)
MPEPNVTMPATADRVLVLTNPKAGPRSSHDRVAALVELLQRRGLGVDVFDKLDEVAARTEQAYAAGRLRALVGVGGDGTAAELANRTAPGMPLSLLPGGNENLLARYLGLDASPERLAQTLAEGHLRRLDAARANGRIFLLMIGCGFDAAVVRRVHQNRSGHISKQSYIKPIVQTLRTYAYPELQVYLRDHGASDCITGQPEATPPLAMRWLFAFNLPCYGGGLPLCRRADGADGQLNLCGFRRGSWWHGLRYLAAVILNRHERMTDCITRQTKRFRVTAAAEVPYQLDGDPAGVLPVEVEVLPQRLTMVVPQSV